MLSENKSAFYFLAFACLLALLVILLGAMTRLKEAGLGCPDWPGCYGQLTIPHQAIKLVNAPFAGLTINPAKTWPEMTHRYAAATLVLLSFAAVVLIIHKRKLPRQPVLIATLLLILLFLQGLLGKWTVTLHLHPLVVMSHLLGGLALLSLLWWLLLRLKPFHIPTYTPSEKTLRPWAMLALLLILLQISLGAWTSANYAAFVCPDFPLCQGQWWPPMDFSPAFHLGFNWQQNYEGGVLSTAARTAIQMSHRLGALITTSYLACLLYKLLRIRHRSVLRAIGLIILLLLIMQIGLGVLNVLWALPLWIAMAHNAVAALLLLTLITLNVYLTHKA
jgi:cytochrome c oxidase assembly protein subunit 15